MKAGFDRSFEELTSLFEFSAAFYETEGIGEGDRLSIDFAIEELFTNLIKHDPEAREPIDIELQRRGETVHIMLLARGAAPFDVTATEAPEIDTPLEERRIGGLGLHLTRQLMSTMRYEHHDGASLIAVTKELD